MKKVNKLLLVTLGVGVFTISGVGCSSNTQTTTKLDKVFASDPTNVKKSYSVNSVAIPDGYTAFEPVSIQKEYAVLKYKNALDTIQDYGIFDVTINKRVSLTASSTNSTYLFNRVVDNLVFLKHTITNPDTKESATYDVVYLSNGKQFESDKLYTVRYDEYLKVLYVTDQQGRVTKYLNENYLDIQNQKLTQVNSDSYESVGTTFGDYRYVCSGYQSDILVCQVYYQDKLIYTVPLIEDDSNIEGFIPVSSNSMLMQSVTKVSDYDTNYTFVSGNSKYLVVTKLVTFNKTAVSEVEVSFPYLINSIVNQYTDSKYASILQKDVTYLSVQPIKNHIITSSTFDLYVDKNLNVLVDVYESPLIDIKSQRVKYKVSQDKYLVELPNGDSALIDKNFNISVEFPREEEIIFAEDYFVSDKIYNYALEKLNDYATYFTLDRDLSSTYSEPLFRGNVSEGNNIYKFNKDTKTMEKVVDNIKQVQYKDELITSIQYDDNGTIKYIALDKNNNVFNLGDYAGVSEVQSQSDYQYGYKFYKVEYSTGSSYKIIKTETSEKFTSN